MTQHRPGEAVGGGLEPIPCLRLHSSAVRPLGGQGSAPSCPWAECPSPSPQPLVFGAMVHRDEAFETIFSQYLKITAGAASGSDS